MANTTCSKCGGTKGNHAEWCDWAPKRRDPAVK